MPYKSKAQAAKFHEMLKQGKIKPEVVAEFDKASAGLKLPERAPKPLKVTSIQQIREIGKRKARSK